MATQLKQGTSEWLEARRALITATDIPVLLGISPYKSEATLAREKLGEVEPSESTLVMRVGSALEPVIADEYQRQRGVTLRRFHGMVSHPVIGWAAASPDWRRKGERWLVEGKYSTSRRFDEGIPQDVEAQVRWQMGVTGYPIAEVAHLDGRQLHISEPIEHDAQTFADLINIAADFRRRLTTDGPFAEDAASIKAAYPADDGTELIADEPLTEAVVELLRLRALRKETSEAEDRIETAIKTRMATATRLTGPGYSITWKRAKDSELTDWRLVADGLLRQLPTDQRDTLISLHSTTREGARYFRITAGKDSD